MKIIENITFSSERALYNSDNLKLICCRFQGEEDGESALKESRNIELENCFMDLRYPFWHNRNLKIAYSEMTPGCRAALWYSENVDIISTVMHGIKAFRECRDVTITDSDVDSPEFMWRVENVKIHSSVIKGEYAFFESKNIRMDNVRFDGKYSFQYVDGLVLNNSEIKTKDAFWHAKNAVVTDSVIDGEYIGWYSENLTFANCTIVGTQPFCYAKNLKLVNCRMLDADLAFEYSDVEADIAGEILSVKNPLSGTVIADKIGEILITSDSVYPSHADIRLRHDDNS